MTNVYIIGPQCTGKTTLVNALEESFANYPDNIQLGVHAQPLVIREIARTLMKEKSFSREDMSTSKVRALQLQQHILEAQYVAERSASANDPTSWYICDRSGLDPIVYADKHVGTEAATQMLSTETWSELETRMKQGIVVLCEPGCHWLTDDGIRLMPTDTEDWIHVGDVFRRLLEARGISYSIVSKDLEDLGKRVKFVRGLIEATYERKSYE